MLQSTFLATDGPVIPDFGGPQGGKHGCIGMMFAYLQIKAIWSMLLRRFELELVQDSPRPDYTTFVVGPRPPCWIRYRRRRRFALPVSRELTTAAAVGAE